MDLYEWRQEIGLAANRERSYEEGLIKLIFKVYPGGVMTNYMNSISIGNILNLQGPLGPGLLLDEYRGDYIGFAGGTGLVPFLDLVYFAWQHSKFTVTQFHLTLLVSFRTYNDGFALDILEKMQQVIEGNWFELILLHDTSPHKKSVEDIVKGMAKNNVDKAWICGPSGFNQYYLELLLKYGVDKKKIVLM